MIETEVNFDLGNNTNNLIILKLRNDFNSKKYADDNGEYKAGQRMIVKALKDLEGELDRLQKEENLAYHKYIGKEEGKQKQCKIVFIFYEIYLRDQKCLENIDKMLQILRKETKLYIDISLGNWVFFKVDQNLMI